MLCLVALWLLISFIVLTLGKATQCVYNKICFKKEEYTYIDLFILGLSVCSIIVGVISLFHAINYKVSIALFTLCIMYWGFNYHQVKEFFSSYIFSLKSYKAHQIILFILFVLSVTLYNIVNPYSFDSVYYHYQQTAWNEQYPVIVGLANLESRFGFNSNHLLISALFSFSKYLGEPLYAIQSLFSLMFGCWIINECIKSNYNTKRIILLILYTLFYFTLSDQITNSSTDIIFSLLIFYIGAKLLFYPNSFKNGRLLFATFPIFLITVKFSSATFILFTIFTLIYLWKEKSYKAFGFTTITCLLIVTPWFIRNVIISGYLVYPISFIDIFAFDWKVPNFVLELEKDYILDYGWQRFKAIITLDKFGAYLSGNRWIFFNVWFNELVACILFIITFLSPIVLSFLSTLKKMLPVHKLLYLTLLLSMAALFLSAPDFRFASGSIYLIAYFVIFSLPPLRLSKSRSTIIGFTCTTLLLLGAIKNIRDLTIQYQIIQPRRPLLSMFFQPYGIKALRNISIDQFDKHQLGNITIYMSHPSSGGVTYDILPASYTTNPPEKMNTQKKFLPIDAIETRGNSIEDGFRPIKSVENGWWVRPKDWWNGH